MGAQFPDPVEPPYPPGPYGSTPYGPAPVPSRSQPPPAPAVNPYQYRPGPVAPPGYFQSGYPYLPPPGNNGLCTASLVVGLVSLLCVSLAGPVAVVLGIVGLNQIRANGARGSGMGIAGIVLGAVATLMLVVGFSLMAVV